MPFCFATVISYYASRDNNNMKKILTSFFLFQDKNETIQTLQTFFLPITQPKDRQPFFLRPLFFCLRLHQYRALTCCIHRLTEVCVNNFRKQHPLARRITTRRRDGGGQASGQNSILPLKAERPLFELVLPPSGPASYRTNKKKLRKKKS